MKKSGKVGRIHSLKKGPVSSAAWNGTATKKGSDAFSASAKRKIKRSAKLSKFTTEAK